MKGEIYNFILHSDIGTSTTVASESFFVDWNRLPESRYKLTFSLEWAAPFLKLPSHDQQSIEATQLTPISTSTYGLSRGERAGDDQ